VRTEPTKQRTFAEWLNQFLENDAAMYENDEYDYWDPATTADMPGGDGNGEQLYGDEIDDGLLESLAFITLAAALAFLVYYRRERQMQHQRQQGNAVQDGVVDQQQPVGGQQGQGQGQQEEERGMFPQPGDPAFMDWAAGGVGH